MPYNLIFLFLCVATLLASQVNPVFVEVASGFDDPVVITNANDGSNRLFVCEQQGIIRIIDDLSTGSILITPFLDIQSRVVSGGEEGLLGMAFHPDFPDSPYFYVQYSYNPGAGSDRNRLARFTVSANPDSADIASERVVMDIIQPSSNHNGGDIHFGPDGYLYLGLGDGGGQMDPNDLAQDPGELLGKLLRINIDEDAFPGDDFINYSIPPDNPFVNDPSTLNEIWAIGFRNPWRISFDALTGDLYIADVGQQSLEEIDFQPQSSGGGENYGWSCKEGTSFPLFNDCLPGPLTDPVFEYAHNLGCSVTGGYVYRGEIFTNFFGKYFAIDYCSGNMWIIDSIGGWSGQMFNMGINNISTFGQSESLELYAANIRSADDKIYRLFDLSACQDTLVIDPAPGDYNLAEINIQAATPLPEMRTFTFSAGESVEMMGEFSVPDNSTLDLWIETCTNFILNRKF